MNIDRLKKLKEWEAQKPYDPFLKFAIAQEFVSDANDAEAAVYYTMLANNFPDYLPLYYQFGQLKERNGEIDEAIRLYKKGIQLAKATGDVKTAHELNRALIMLDDE